MNNRLQLLLIGLLTVLCSSVMAGGNSVEFRGVESFRSALLNDLKNNRIDAVVRRAHSTVELTHGGLSGHGAFREKLSRSHYRNRLIRALELGGSINEQQGHYCAPAIVCDGPNSDWPVNETAFIVKKKAPCHIAPFENSPIMHWVETPVVRLFGNPPAKNWLGVIVRGEFCVVPGDQLYSALDLRIVMSPIEGNWRITSVLGGD